VVFLISVRRQRSLVDNYYLKPPAVDPARRRHRGTSWGAPGHGGTWGAGEVGGVFVAAVHAHGAKCLVTVGRLARDDGLLGVPLARGSAWALSCKLKKNAKRNTNESTE
jgi:hypothetical protein